MLKTGDIVRHKECEFYDERGRVIGPLIGIVDPKDLAGIHHVRTMTYISAYSSLLLTAAHEDFTYYVYDDMADNWELLC